MYNYTGSPTTSLAWIQILTLGPEEKDLINHNIHYLGDIETTLLLLTTLVVFLLGCGLNMGAVLHFRNKLKDTSAVTPFLCYALGRSNLALSACAGLHMIMFAVLIAHQDIPAGWFALAAPAYYLTFIAVKISAFVCMLVAVLRALSIVFPCHKINRSAVAVCIAMWGLLWLVLACIEFGVYAKASGLDREALHNFILEFFNQPNRPRVLEFFIAMTDSYDDLRQKEASWQALVCGVNISYMGVLMLLCAALALASTLILLASHCLYQKGETEVFPFTFSLLSFSFIVCAGCTLYHPITLCTGDYELKIVRLYVLGTLSFFLLSVVQPIIMLTGMPSMRACLWGRIRGNPCKHCSGVKYDPVEI